MNAKGSQKKKKMPCAARIPGVFGEGRITKASSCQAERERGKRRREGSNPVLA